MTRKRFVKLLMSHGYSRDLAMRLARRRPARCSYARFYPTAVKASVPWFVTCYLCHQSLHSVAASFKRFAAAMSNFGTERR